MPVQTDRRQTGLIARIVDTSLNEWEDFAGFDINPLTLYQPVDTSTGPSDYNYWGYRGQASMVQLGNGNIVRVRIGNPVDANDRDVYQQIITDPTDPTQWQAWTDLNYDTNYAIAVERDDAEPKGYRIYHSKVDAFGNGRLYVDNNLISLVFGNPIIRIKVVYGVTNFIYIQRLNAGSDARIQSWDYVPDTRATGPAAIYFDDCYDLLHVHHDIAAIIQGTTAWRIRARSADGQERVPMASDVLQIETADATVTTGSGSSNTFNKYHDAVFLKGPSKRNGYTRMDNLFVTNITDAEYPQGTWYLFYTEQHMDQFSNILSNLKAPVFWSRSVTLPYFSEAMPVGYSLWGLAGAISMGGYVYLAGNGRVLRRPLDRTSIDITNYVMSGSYETPRDNGKASASLVLANPDNVIGSQLGVSADVSGGALTERKVEFGIGLKQPNDITYTFKRAAQWWLATVNSAKEEAATRLELKLEDFWHRLETPFKDIWSIPGHFDWSDWQPDASNSVSDYVNEWDEQQSYTPVGAPASSVPRLLVNSSNSSADLTNYFSGTAITSLGGTISLFTGFGIGVNVSVSVTTWANTGVGIVLRYKDIDNFMIVRLLPAGLEVTGITDGTYNLIAGSTPFTKLTAVPTTLQVDLIGPNFTVYVNGVSAYGDNMFSRGQVDGLTDAGSVGIWAPSQIQVSNLIVKDYNAPVTTRELIRHLLAYAGEHDVTFDNNEETLSAPQLDMLWGPQQSDLDTPEKALRQLLETSKLNIVYRQDS